MLSWYFIKNDIVTPGSESQTPKFHRKNIIVNIIIGHILVQKIEHKDKTVAK